MISCFNQYNRAAKCCIVEVEELVEPGEIRPDEVHLPGIFVHRILKGEFYARRIWKLAADGDDEQLSQHLSNLEST